MTEARKPLDSALDLFVYVPVGLAVTAAEELPKLAAKGRSRVTTQLTMARVVGQFAFSRGRSLLEQRVEHLASPAAGAGAPTGESSRPVGANGHRDEAARSQRAYGELTPDAVPDRSARAHLRPVPTDAVAGADDHGRTEPEAPGAESVVGEGEVPKSSISTPQATSLAIPGYDSLSASQVVQRLAGLSQQELAEVGAYEEGHRGRRTILNRVNQLKDQ